MKSVDKIMEDIETLREKLMELIQANESLIDSEVLKASELLDDALVEYNRVIVCNLRDD